jgi:hypothetical protein
VHLFLSELELMNMLNFLGSWGAVSFLLFMSAYLLIHGQLVCLLKIRIQVNRVSMNIFFVYASIPYPVPASPKCTFNMG